MVGLGDDLVDRLPDRRQIDVHRGEGQGRPGDAAQLRAGMAARRSPSGGAIRPPGTDRASRPPARRSHRDARPKQPPHTPPRPRAARSGAWTRASTAWPGRGAMASQPLDGPGIHIQIGPGPAPAVVDGPPRLSADHPGRGRRSTPARLPAFRSITPWIIASELEKAKVPSGSLTYHSGGRPEPAGNSRT